MLYRNLCPFDYKYYLDDVNVAKYRHSFSRLRTSSHWLEIAIGRWQKTCKIPVSDRLFKVCNKLGDEFHFVLKCKLYVEIRRKCIHKYYWQHSSMQKLIDLLACNSLTFRNLAVFVYKEFEIHIKCIMNIKII